jgi:hypothetical protein
MSAQRIYDRERDGHGIADDFETGVIQHCGHLAATLEFLLDHIDDPLAASRARIELNHYHRWLEMQKTRARGRER